MSRSLKYKIQRIRRQNRHAEQQQNVLRYEERRNVLRGSRGGIDLGQVYLTRCSREAGEKSGYDG